MTVIVDEQTTVRRNPLTEREREVLLLLSNGSTDREIAYLLFISPKTVEKHVSSARSKLHAPSRAAAVAAAMRERLI
jgi:DNA-binding NarL/FixJ family response regulator